MGRKREVQRDLFDNEKLKAFVKERELDTIELARRTAYSQDTIVKYLNKNPSVELKEPTLRLIIAMAGGKYEDFVTQKITQHEEPVEEIAQPVKEILDIQPIIEKLEENKLDIQPLLNKFDELITTINRLGNIEMQNMEYLKQLRDLMK